MGDRQDRKRLFTEAIAPRPKTQTQLKARSRSLSYSDALIAVEWLNAAAHRKSPNSSYHRAVELYGELQSLGNALDSLNRGLKKLRTQSTREEMESSIDETLQYGNSHESFRVRHNALNRLLAKYAHVPALAYNVETGTWRFGMVPKRQGKTHGLEITVQDQSFTVRVNEITIVAALARLAANRELYKVCLCPQCKQRWRVSERKMDRFCSSACREASNASSDEYKARKARNRREARSRRMRAEANGANLK